MLPSLTFKTVHADNDGADDRDNDHESPASTDRYLGKKLARHGVARVAPLNTNRSTQNTSALTNYWTWGVIVSLVILSGVLVTLYVT